MNLIMNTEELIPYAGIRVGPQYLLYNEEGMKNDLSKMRKKMLKLAKKYQCELFVFIFSKEEIA